MNISDVKIGGLYYLLLPPHEHYYEIVVNFPSKVGNWEAHDTIHVIYSDNCRNETFMVLETLEIERYDKIMGDENIQVNPTCVRVPVFVGHSEALHIELEKELSAAQAQAILREAPGVMLVDKREDRGLS